MTDLGRFLECFYSPLEPFESVEARVVHQKFSTTTGSSGGRRPIGLQRVGPGATDRFEESYSFSAIPPEMVRFKKRRDHNGILETELRIVNAEFTWYRHSNGIVEQDARKRSRRTDDLPTEYRRHFDRLLLRDIFSALTLTYAGSAIVADRECVLIRANVIPDSQLWPHWLPVGATEYEFAADLERPVLLAIRGKIGDETLESFETQNVRFDELTDVSKFIYEPNPLESVQKAVPISETLSLAAAVKRTSFMVFHPSYVPDADKMHIQVMYRPQRPSSETDSLVTFFLGSAAFDQLWITQCDARKTDTDPEFEWQELNVGDKHLKFSQPDLGKGISALSFDINGTKAVIYSDLPKEEMVKIAISFKPYT